MNKAHGFDDIQRVVFVVIFALHSPNLLNNMTKRKQRPIIKVVLGRKLLSIHDLNKNTVLEPWTLWRKYIHFLPTR